MCGIVAYFGKKAAQPILVEGLKRLEYRGYDSAGIALLSRRWLSGQEDRGRIAPWRTFWSKPEPPPDPGHRPHPLGHPRGSPTRSTPTRTWTTPARSPSSTTASSRTTPPSRSGSRARASRSSAETDTEVIANLIGYLYAKACSQDRPSNGQNAFEWAVQQALQRLHGTFGLAILCSDFPGMLIGARKGSPLILGVGNGEYILASDAAAIVEHTTQAIYLADNEMVTIDADGFHTKTIDKSSVSKDVTADRVLARADRAGRLRALHAQGDLRAAPVAEHLPARPAESARAARSCWAACPTTCAS